LYEALVAAIPIEPVVGRYLVGQGWTVVESRWAGAGRWPDDDPGAGGRLTGKSGGGMGLAMAFPRPPGTGQELRASLAGRPLRDVAEGLRSWDLSVAAIGMAAVNAHYNQRDRLEELLGRGLTGPVCEPVFVTMADEVAGRKVAVVGHFPGLERLAARCELTVLEREPQPGDLPDPAAEYLLPEQDYVFITGTTVINKTLPRLLQLCAGARVVLVGPSVPFTTALFDLGVDVLAGSVVVDPQGCWTAACEGGGHEIWTSSAVRLQVRAGEF
jgi:uncharacterized protein (DUF4213/DUF364 family)